jgi:predicted Zn-dependent protease
MLFQTQVFYFDGQTSFPHKTELFLDNIARELKFTTDDGNAIYNSIYSIDYEIYNNKMRIKFNNSELHIVIDDKNFISELENLINANVKNNIYQKLIKLNFKFHLFIAFAVISMITVIYIFIIPIVVQKAVRLIPVAYDVQIGDIAAKKYIETIKIDSAKTALLNEFASKMTWDNKINLKFFIVDSSLVNAFSFPNGNIVVFSGLLNKINNYETLTALLAHEVSHINKRHSMQAICRSLIGYALVSILLTDISGLTAVILENAEMFNNLSYSRDMELEADNMGLALLDKNEINSDGMVKLMVNLQENSASNFYLLSTHPAMETRIKNAETKIKEKKYAQKPELEQIFEKISQSRKLSGMSISY